MGRLTWSLIRRFSEWERAAQIGMVVAVSLLVVVLLAGALGPPDIRLSVVIGVMGLLLVMQLIVLWANRGLVAPYTEAQRLYLQEDFEGALAVLEEHRPTLDPRGLTLLGNAYRQLGRVNDSEMVLREAASQAPQHYFPLFGLGKTLVAQGRYAEAARMLGTALDKGAPSATKVDLGEALYRAGQHTEARTVLSTVDLEAVEPYRALLVAYLLGREISPEEKEAGLPYWAATARRFEHTDYGRAVAEDVSQLRRL